MTKNEINQLLERALSKCTCRRDLAFKLKVRLHTVYAWFNGSIPRNDKIEIIKNFLMENER